MNAATRILSPTGIITSEDRSQVLEHAAEILAYMRNRPRDEHCSPECNSVQGVLAAALLCMSDDVAKLDKEAAAHEAELATAELKDAYCTRQPAPAAMVNLRKPPPTLLPSVGQLSGNPGSWWEIVFDAAVLMGMAMVMMLLLGALAKC